MEDFKTHIQSTGVRYYFWYINLVSFSNQIVLII